MKVRTTIEEEIFYPAFKEAGQKSDDDKMFFEAMEEHRAAGDLVLPDLLKTQVTTDKFGGRAKVSRNWSNTTPAKRKRKCSRGRARCWARRLSSNPANGWRRASRR